MLKIKEEVDLKELKKFGFKEEVKCKYSFYYYSYVIEDDGARIVICKPNACKSLHRYYADRELFFDYSPLYDDEEFKEKLDRYQEILFDLIQAGMIEKV